jgi:hypothetical protein
MFQNVGYFSEIPTSFSTVIKLSAIVSQLTTTPPILCPSSFVVEVVDVIFSIF